MFTNLYILMPHLPEHTNLLFINYKIHIQMRSTHVLYIIALGLLTWGH